MSVQRNLSQIKLRATSFNIVQLGGQKSVTLLNATMLHDIFDWFDRDIKSSFSLLYTEFIKMADARKRSGVSYRQHGVEAF